MATDSCPECDAEVQEVKQSDARPGGALLKVYIHEKGQIGPFPEITESCTEVIEWGENADKY